MPVKIQNVITLEIRLIDKKEVKTFPTNIWHVVSQKDIYRVYEASMHDHREIIERGEHEKERLEEVLLSHPNAQFDKLPDSENWDRLIISKKWDTNQSLESERETGNLLPINKPKQYANKITSAIINPVKSIFQNDYFKYTTTGVIVYIIGYFLYEFFKYKKW